MVALVRAGLHHMQVRESAHEGIRPDDAVGTTSREDVGTRSVDTILLIRVPVC